MNSRYISESTIGDNTIYHINHPKFTASISKFGGHVLSFSPNGQRELLWLSKTAVLDGSKAIRGGIPLCWPWFGPATGKNQGKPQHGYARITPWSFSLIEETESNLVLELTPDFAASLIEELDFDLKVILKFDETLTLELHSSNKTSQAQELSQAIHSYFSVGDINNTVVEGLKDTKYTCKVTDKEVVQDAELKLTSHSDRVYQTANSPILVKDGVRQLDISGDDHDSVVVWNPWQENAQSMADFDDLGYKTMICIEMANTQGLVLEAGETHVMSQTIKLASITKLPQDARFSDAR